MHTYLIAWQPLVDFQDFIVGILQNIWGTISNAINSIWLLLRMSVNIAIIPTFLSTHIWSPIAICGSFVVIVGIVKIFIGRHSQ